MLFSTAQQRKTCCCMYGTVIPLSDVQPLKNVDSLYIAIKKAQWQCLGSCFQCAFDSVMNMNDEWMFTLQYWCDGMSGLHCSMVIEYRKLVQMTQLLWKQPSYSYLPSLISPVHFQIILQALASDLVNTRKHNWLLVCWPCITKYSLLISALRTWWRLDGAHQLIWKEILLQLQDRGVPVGEAQRMAGEVAIILLPKPLDWRHFF